MTMKAKRIHLMISIFFFFSRKGIGKKGSKARIENRQFDLWHEILQIWCKKVFFSSSVIYKVRVFEKIRFSPKRHWRRHRHRRREQVRDRVRYRRRKVFWGAATFSFSLCHKNVGLGVFQNLKEITDWIKVGTVAHWNVALKVTSLICLLLPSPRTNTVSNKQVAWLWFHFKPSV